MLDFFQVRNGNGSKILVENGNGNWYKPNFEASARRRCFGLRTTAMRIYSEVIEEVYLPHMGQSCSPM